MYVQVSDCRVVIFLTLHSFVGKNVDFPQVLKMHLIFILFYFTRQCYAPQFCYI